MNMNNMRLPTGMMLSNRSHPGMLLSCSRRTVTQNIGTMCMDSVMLDSSMIMPMRLGTKPLSSFCRLVSVVIIIATKTKIRRSWYKLKNQYSERDALPLSVKALW